MQNTSARARSFLAGEHLGFDDANKLWQQLEQEDELSLARTVLRRIREGQSLLDGLPGGRRDLDELCRQEAKLTSKDQELSATVRHRRALEILRERFDLEDPSLDGDSETLGIAGGIQKRQWEDLGQYDDLRLAAVYYRRGAAKALGDDAYAQINAAFLEDLLASQGDNSAERRRVADELRTRVVEHIPASTTSWWSAASRAEALLGLGRYVEATKMLKGATRPERWKLQSTTRQMAMLAHLRVPAAQSVPEIQDLFEALLPGAAAAVRSSFIGKVGLALSGGGFRASFYHLGVLARLAELDVLRHVEVLSCVSGGSIVGACYWLSLRRRMLDSPLLTSQDYVALVASLIEHFEAAVGLDIRHQIQRSKAAMAFDVIWRGQQGAIDPEKTADALDEHFYRPLYSGAASSAPETIFMDELPFTPKDHDPVLTGSPNFLPGRHNWLRAHKVPALVLNATTVNTGRGWQFTPTWMGESPWALNDGADNIERLEWAWYQPEAKWRIRLARAVAASAGVPGIFAPLKLGNYYNDVDVQLVDGGVYDNQGVASLLASNCNVLLVSDAAGQLMLERQSAPGLKGLASYAGRAMDILMERIRQATYADLCARHMSGLIRGLMFLHMKAGLDADTIRLPFSQETFQIVRSPLSPSGVRKDFQKALAELRTDLNAFTETESKALMACGYQMASKAFAKDLANKVPGLAGQPAQADWPFSEMLEEITSTKGTTANRDTLLAELRKGSKVIV